MRAPVTGAVLCAIAAVALLVAGFTPWFSTGKEIGGGWTSHAREVRLDRFDDDEREPVDVRANFGLVNGEVCFDLACKTATYTGADGLSDDAFAWLGRGTLGAAMASVVLLVAVALAARRQRRAHLRGWAGAMAAVAAGLGAAFAAAWTFDAIDPRIGHVSRGMGLTACILGAAFAGLGVAWPMSRGGGALARRIAIAAPLALFAVLAWVTVVEHAWWRSGNALAELGVSPIGVEVCDAGECKVATAFGTTTTQRALAALAALATAALLVPAFGAAARVARGIRPGAWGWAAAIVGVCALGAGIATWVVYPSSDVMKVAWGIPAFAIATLGTSAAAAAGIVLVRDADTEIAVHAQPHAHAHDAGPANAIAPGERPQLAPLAPPTTPAAPVAVAAAPRAVAAEPSNAVSRYAPSAAVAAAAIEAATGRTYVPAAAIAVAPVAANADADANADTNGSASAPLSASAAAPSYDVAAAHALAAPPEARGLLPEARGPRPEASASPAGPVPQAPARKATPICPRCRVATLYSSKRAAWWCSTCKQTL